jgi:hypothetical protein
VSSGSASEYPDFCNVVTESTQISRSYLYIGPYYDLHLNLPQNPVHNLPEPISNGDLDDPNNYLKGSGLLPPGYEGKIIMPEVRYPDDKTIVYKIQPGFSAVGEIDVSTVETYDGVPSNVTPDVYYPIIPSVRTSQVRDPSLTPGHSLYLSSITGKSQRSILTSVKNLDPARNPYLKTTGSPGKFKRNEHSLDFFHFRMRAPLPDQAVLWIR